MYKKTGVKKISYTANLSGNNHYYVKIVAKGKKAKGYFSASIKQHLDSKINSSGGVWSVDKESGIADGSGKIIYQNRIYFSKKNVNDAIAMVANDKTLDKQQMIYNVTWWATSGLVSAKYPGAAVLFSAISLKQSVNGLNFKDVTIKQVKNKSGYTQYANGKSSCRNGVVITTYLYNGMEMMQIDSWTSSTMTGKAGYKGNWK